MIAPESFTIDWINSHRKDKRFSRINPPVLEKMIWALSLLEALVTQELKFIFKGGTSLVLMMSEPRRFSVDIDIITQHSQKELEQSFDKIVEAGAFTKWELDELRSYKEGVPKAHYLFHYNSHLNKQVGYILLDILFEEHGYPEIIQRPIESLWLKITGNPTLVHVPSIESILGDKLTAFAPNTTGVLYGKEKSLEIVKQLHDVGHLFDLAKEIKAVDQSFQILVAQELKYRSLNMKAEHVLDDIISTALLLGKTRKNHSDDEKLKYKELETGIVQLAGFIMTGAFYIDHAIEGAAKAAYIAAKLRVKDFSPLQLYNDSEIDFQFETMPYNTLNRLRKMRNGSLFYWSKTAELLGIK